MLLGMCFPIGVRLIEEPATRGQSDFVSGDRPQVLAWAWGVNGAFSVLASIVAVAISMWIEIDANFWIAG